MATSRLACKLAAEFILGDFANIGGTCAEARKTGDRVGATAARCIEWVHRGLGQGFCTIFLIKFIAFL